MIYKWKPGSRIPVNPQIAGEHLRALERKLQAKIKPADVVADARSSRSPLHKAFEWDNSVAGERYREAQASLMLRALITVVVNVTKPKEVHYTRVYVNVHEPGTTDKTYRPMVDVLDDPKLRTQMLETALEEFRLWRDRYSRLTELAKVFEAGDLVIGKLVKAA